jgi:hypothetical protein
MARFLLRDQLSKCRIQSALWLARNQLRRRRKGQPAEMSRTSPRRSMLPLLGAVVGMALASGCQDELRSVAVGEAEAAASTELQLTRKLDPYIQCIEEHSADIQSARRHYLTGIKDAMKGANCPKRRYSIRQLAPVASCTQELARAAKEPPSLPALETVGARFAKHLSELAKLLQQAKDYYEGSAYLRDACARAPELNKQLTRIWNQLQDEEHELRELVETQNGKLLERELQRTLELHGRGLRFYHKRLQVEAQRVVRTARQQEGKKAANLELLSTVVVEFEATFEALQKVARKMPEELESALFWESYLAQAVEFRKAVREFINRRMEGRPYSAKETQQLGSNVAHWVAGSAAKVKREYDELTRISSDLEFRH